VGISLVNMLGPIAYRLKCPGMHIEGEGGTRTVVVNKEREWRRGGIDVTDVTIGIKVTKISVAHKTVNSEPKNIILGSLESL
jgi:hypothetical protein